MQKSQAIQIIKETFEGPFNKEQFVYFTKNLFNDIEDDSFIYRGNYIPDAYAPYIRTLERVGKYQDSDGNKIDILIVHLKKETSLERARTMQRNFVAWYLNGSRGGILKDAAIVAFVSPDSQDWRFSLIKMEYKLTESKDGKTKVKQELTPARRWSFLVGENENSHTAQKRLLPVLQDDRNNPLLSQLEDAFNIEVVTKEFFEKYRGLFLRTKEVLDEMVEKDERIKNDFAKKGINTVDFAKKLLGQVVFLYFLQKKGWFGVERDAGWGTGPKNFLRLLFKKETAKSKNFFNDGLELLFYEALAVERTDDFYGKLNCKIPFLNGGLFEPINDYDWVHTDIFLPNELFSNEIKTKEGDVGTGILDVFDRYNFTVKEDEPLEKEVAVDPEMLGKVFENLLEVKDRKSKGTYYTPREIVHYMCQESLINYLSACFAQAGLTIEPSSSVISEKMPPVIARSEATKQSLPTKEDIRTLIKYGETVVEHDGRVINKGRETADYSFRLPPSIRSHAEEIDNALKNIRVCDPAIGSGAFPVGMMNEIIRARNALTPYLLSRRDFLNQLPKQSHSSAVILNGIEETRTLYNFKRHAIQNSLYGVDIDPGACEIAKLRLWLSLIVDEEDIKQIKPLPNLDYKIVCGNSLLGVERNLGNWKLFAKLEELKPLFFNETNTNKKQDYKLQIDELISKITNGHKDFDFEVYFSEVFHEKNGFDVVIANPPYVEHKKLKGFSTIFKSKFKTYSGTTDLYVYFYEIAINILKIEGVLTFISSNKFIRTSYGAKLRGLLANNRIHQIINFTKVQVFDALVASCVMIVSKGEKNKNALFSDIDNMFIKYNSLSDFIRKHHIKVKTLNLNKNIWQLESSNKLELKTKIETKSNKLYKVDGIKIFRGITTGYNAAFIISELEREQLCKADSNNKDIIKPLLQGRNIKKWQYRRSNNFLLLTKYDLNIPKKYPIIFNYLEKFKTNLVKRADQGVNWWNLRACSYYFEFEKEKIIWGLTADKWAFAYDDKRHYLPSNGYILTSTKVPIKYILALLNSKLMKFYFGFIGIMTAGGAFTLKHQTISEFPIKEIPITKQEPFISLADKILAITKDDDYLANSIKQDKVRNYERQIDEMVYKLYNLTPEEIKIVEGFKNK